MCAIVKVIDGGVLLIETLVALALLGITAVVSNTYELTVKACHGEAVAERSYQIKQRPGSL